MSASAGSALSLATTRGTLLHATWRPARALPISMGTWDELDVKIMPVPLPDAIEDLLSDDTDRELTQIMWSAFVKCYASEDDAIAACQRSSVSIMHYLNRPSNIVGTFRYLEEELGTDGARGAPKSCECKRRYAKHASRNGFRLVSRHQLTPSNRFSNLGSAQM